MTVASLTIVKTASVSTTTPGSTVGYTIVVTNTGPTAYTGATFTDPLGGVLDDATYNGDATAEPQRHGGCLVRQPEPDLDR